MTVTDSFVKKSSFFDKDVLGMDKLRRLFVNTIQTHEDPDLSDYR